MMEKNCSQNFHRFGKKNNKERYSRNNSLKVVFAERFSCTNRDLLKKLDFEKGDADWIDVSPTINNQYKKQNILPLN